MKHLGPAGIVLLIVALLFFALAFPASAANESPKGTADHGSAPLLATGTANQSPGLEGMAYREGPPGPSTPAPGYIRVSSTPPDAIAIIDESQRMATPYVFMAGGERYHAVRVQRAGYQPYFQSVFVNSWQTADVTATLVQDAAKTGGASITSNPPGADIYIDGSYRGETPVTVGGLSPGTYTLLLRKAGYLEASDKITITPGMGAISQFTLKKYQPGRGFGSVEVVSEPPGVFVYLDGTFQGITHFGKPLDLTGLKSGNHTIMMELTDYEPVSQDVLITDGSVLPVIVRMKTKPATSAPDLTGELYIGSSPSDADVYLDSRYLGTTPMSLADIPAGNHTVLLQMDGYSDWKGAIQVTGGQSATVSETLTEIPVTTPTKAGNPAMVLITGIIAIGAVLIVSRLKER